MTIAFSTCTLSFALLCFYALPYVFTHNFIHFLLAFTCSFLEWYTDEDYESFISFKRRDIYGCIRQEIFHQHIYVQKMLIHEKKKNSFIFFPVRIHLLWWIYWLLRTEFLSKSESMLKDSKGQNSFKTFLYLTDILMWNDE